MRIRRYLIPVITIGVAISAHAFVLDWERIEHWAGSGSNKAALVVQFADGGPEEAYVWGFRWNDDDFDGGTPSGEDMFRGIVAESADLLLFTQFTGSLGSTVDGIGYFDPEGPALASRIAYDFDGAKADPRVSFDYFTPNTLMNQTKAPGNFTPAYCRRAIQQAADTRIIEHPINAREYGYPAYDYDWWQPSEPLDLSSMRWNAGWYDGYWSYWVGGPDFEELSYSGLGYSSRKLRDGQVDAWKYTMLDGPITDWSADGSTGASEAWHQLNYSHFNASTAITSATVESTVTAVYNLRGEKVTGQLPAGVYVIHYSDGHSAKIIVK